MLDLFEHEEDYYKPIKSKGAFGDNFLEFESNGNRNKNLSLAQYLHEIQPYFKETISSFIACNEAWEISVTLKLFFVY